MGKVQELQERREEPRVLLVAVQSEQILPFGLISMALLNEFWNQPLFIWTIILLVWPVEASVSPMLVNFVYFRTRWSNWTVEIIRTEVYRVFFSDLHGSASDNLVVVSFVKLAMYISITIYSICNLRSQGRMVIDVLKLLICAVEVNSEVFIYQILLLL